LRTAHDPVPALRLQHENGHAALADRAEDLDRALALVVEHEARVVVAVESQAQPDFSVAVVKPDSGRALAGRSHDDLAAAVGADDLEHRVDTTSPAWVDSAALTVGDWTCTTSQWPSIIPAADRAMTDTADASLFMPSFQMASA
jgi:hypothetical protein